MAILSPTAEPDEASGRLTGAIADFIVHFPEMELPVQAVDMAVDAFTDLAACLVAGAGEPVVRHLDSFVAGSGTASLASSVLLNSDRRAPPAEAALVNGAAGHALDYDDVAFGAHPSTVLVPAILAEGERLRISGMDAIRAYLVGYEVWGELARREPDSYHFKGWHPTSVIGPVAAAAALSFLRKLDAVQCVNALSFAASQASGIVANFGSMAKPYQAGRAAAAGAEAAALAEAGLVGAADALEHPSGLLAALSPRGGVDRISEARLGSHWAALSNPLSFKKYPCCFATHRVIDAVLKLIQAEACAASNISRIAVTMRPAQAGILKYHRPANALEAKFSIEFAVAAALIARRVGLAELAEDFVHREDVQALIGKIAVGTGQTEQAGAPPAQSDRIVIVAAGGNVLDSGDITDVESNMNLEQKFFDCSRRSPGIRAEPLYAMLQALPALRNIQSLALAATHGTPEEIGHCGRRKAPSLQ